MHSLKDVHTHTKKDPNEVNLQQGSGEAKTDDNKNETTEELKGSHTFQDLLQQSKPLLNNDDPITFNERKRKEMDKDIHESFLHPSFVKTSKISVPRLIKKKILWEVTKKKKLKRQKLLNINLNLPNGLEWRVSYKLI